MKLVEGKKYEIINSHGEKTIAELKEIMTYSMMPTDYLFKWISGNRNLCGKSPIAGPDEFPLPQMIITKLVEEHMFSEVTKELPDTLF